MTRLDSLKSLQTRIREATGADRELDKDIHVALRFKLPGKWGADLIDTCFPSYTTDPDGLGACVGLMREVLPGCEWAKDRRGEIIIFDELPAKIWAVVAIAKSLANDCLTFLDAICAAPIAEEEAKLTEKAG